ncbi:MAG: ABC transporter ATP-binding protein [Bacteroidota bacterium]|nr:ABC transporter ATP-binding protein [Bacteroidota bacterium]
MDKILKSFEPNARESQELAIKVENVSKTFYTNEDTKFSLRSLFSSFFRQGKTKKFRVLRNVNIEIKKGEFVGLIGKNGSGKSTLLKLIAGIYNPDHGGKIQVNGSLVPFLELGVGFNTELSGRENIYLNGTILGMTKKFLDSKFKEIVKFADLAEFIETPVKNYSSGMLVRLAFSIAIQSHADIYILDEILAVGDENFQRKSRKVINRFKREKKTILFVSHDTNAIQTLCDRAILIDEHEVCADGNPASVIQEYRRLIEPQAEIDAVKMPEGKTTGESFGEKLIEITDVKITDNAGKQKSVYTTADIINISISYKNNSSEPHDYYIGVAIGNEVGQVITGTNSKNYQQHSTLRQTGTTIYKLAGRYFVDGKYYVTIGVFDYNTEEALHFLSQMYSFDMLSYGKDIGQISLPAEWEVS